MENSELRLRRRDDERGAEMIEFAIVVVLLITLLYGIISYGLILAAQSTITQAAADAAPIRHRDVDTDVATAEAQAGTDVGWMDKGTCGDSGTTITCDATPEACPSNANAQCLKVTVAYNYSSSPLFPELPGLGVITPSTISSTNVLQISTRARRCERVTRLRGSSPAAARRAGAVLVLTAISMVALLGGGAMGVDVGFSVYGSRQAQAMADTGALDLVQNINVADGLSDELGEPDLHGGLLAGVETDNSATNSTLTVTPGVWTGRRAPSRLRRRGATAPVFQTSPPPCNAVKVTASQAVPQIFWGGFNTLTGHSERLAAVTPEDGFSIGSYLASFDTQQIRGPQRPLEHPRDKRPTSRAVGYQGLANTYVTVNQLIAASAGVASLTPSNVLTTSLTASDWLTILTRRDAPQTDRPRTAAPRPSRRLQRLHRAAVARASGSAVGRAVPALLHQRLDLRGRERLGRPGCPPTSTCCSS